MAAGSAPRQARPRDSPPPAARGSTRSRRFAGEIAGSTWWWIARIRLCTVATAWPRVALQVAGTHACRGHRRTSRSVTAEASRTMPSGVVFRPVRFEIAGNESGTGLGASNRRMSSCEPGLRSGPTEPTATRRPSGRRSTASIDWMMRRGSSGSRVRQTLHWRASSSNGGRLAGGPGQRSTGTASDQHRGASRDDHAAVGGGRRDVCGGRAADQHRGRPRHDGVGRPLADRRVTHPRRRLAADENGRAARGDRSPTVRRVAAAGGTSMRITNPSRGQTHRPTPRIAIDRRRPPVRTGEFARNRGGETGRGAEAIGMS